MTDHQSTPAAQWYTGRDGQPAGPFDVHDVERQVQSGHLRPDDSVWCTGWPEWRRAGDVFKAAPTPPPLKPAGPPPLKKTAPGTTAAKASAPARPNHRWLWLGGLGLSAVGVLAAVLMQGRAPDAPVAEAAKAPVSVASETPTSNPPTASVAMPKLPRYKKPLFFDGHTLPAFRIQFSRDGNEILSATKNVSLDKSVNNSVQIWSVDGAEKTTIGNFSNDVSAALDASGQFIATITPGEAVVREAQRKAKIVRTISDIGGNGPLSLAISGGPKVLVTAANSYLKEGGGPKIKIWSIDSGELLAHLDLTTFGNHPVYSIAIAPDGSRLAALFGHGITGVWEVPSGKLLTQLGANKDTSSGTVKFSADGASLLTMVGDEVVLCQTQSANCEVVAKGGDSTTGADMSPNGERIAIAANRDLKIFTRIAPTGWRETVSLTGGWYTDASFSPDGKYLAASLGRKLKQVVIYSAAQDDLIELSKMQRLALSKYDEALSSFDCNSIAAFEDVLGVYKGKSNAASCDFDRLMSKGLARDIYLAAVKYETEKDRDKAKTLYKAVLERFPKDDVAIEASKRLTAMSDADVATKAAADQKEQEEISRRAKAALEESQKRSKSAFSEGDLITITDGNYGYCGTIERVTDDKYAVRVSGFNTNWTGGVRTDSYCGGGVTIGSRSVADKTKGDLVYVDHSCDLIRRGKDPGGC